MTETYGTEDFGEDYSGYYEDGEVVVEEEEPVVEEGEAEDGEVLRVTDKPETGTVRFNVLRPFGWGGHRFVVGEAELDEEEFDQMLYELNLRTDRLRFVERLG